MLNMTRDELLDAITELRVSKGSQVVLKEAYHEKVYWELYENSTKEELASLFEQERTKKYRVYLHRSETYFVDVEATTKEEAEALAKDMRDHYTYVTDSVTCDVVEGNTKEIE